MNYNDIDYLLKEKLRNLYNSNIEWRTLLDFTEDNNEEWYEFIQVGNDFFLSQFSRDIIHSVFPIDKELLLISKHFPDLPSNPITQSVNETQLSLKNQSCFFDIFLAKSIYLTWLTKTVYPILDVLSNNLTDRRKFSALSNLSFKIEKNLLGIVYYGIYSDLDNDHSYLDTTILTRFARDAFTNMEIDLADFIYILHSINYPIPETLDSIINKSYLDLGDDLGVLSS